MKQDNLTDKDLWEAVVNDDGRAFTVLYNRYWKKLYRSAMFYLKDTEGAELIVHDAFVTLWQRRKHLKIQDFDSYIYVTVKYLVYKHLSAKPITSESLDGYSGMASVKSSAVEKINYAHTEYNLRVCLSGLPEACRKIFLMSRLEHLSNDEIAQKLEINKRTVENQITRALKHLRLASGELIGGWLFLYL